MGKRKSKPVQTKGAKLDNLAALEKTIEQLEGEQWGEPTYDSYVVKTSHSLRTKPLGTLSDEEIRLALSQDNGVRWVLPLAVTKLRENPMCEGIHYPGDLMAAALRLPKTAWDRFPEVRTELQALAERALIEEGDALHPLVDTLKASRDA
jgi:hypothetical protein